MTVTERVLERAGALLHRHIGLRLEPSPRNRLSRAIADGAGIAGTDPEAYIEHVAVDPAALQGLFDRVTVQETGFFRHPAHFEVLAEHVLPTLAPPVRIWSAACSNGQEPYSIAMVLAETGVDGEVLATDLSTAAVRRTLDGRYSARELHGLSAARQAAHGMRAGTGWEVSPNVRRRVRAEVRNLLGPLPPDVSATQVVFVRNVLIYFTPDHASAFVERLADQLPAGAHVFLGGAESMWHLSTRFEPVYVGGTFVYRLRSGSAAAPRRPARRVATARRAGARWPTPASSPEQPRRTGAGRSRAARTDASNPARTPRTTAASAVTADDVARRGLEAFAAADHAAAVHAFRQWAYLEPEDPVAHFHLGIALEEAGDRAAASRSYERSRMLLLDGYGATAAASFGGYTLDEVMRLLESKRRYGA